MTEQINFLEPDTKQIRHQIKNIIESYNHDWDLIAELAQNSVDAIRLEEPVKGHMKLEIDAIEKRIVFEDNGCGISPNELPDLLAPFSSAKDGNPNLIGYKGVGISFVIFSSVFFEIESHHSHGASRASIEGAWGWIDSQTDKLPTLNYEEIKPRETHGTVISIKLPTDSDNEFFHRSFDQLEMVLRTRTAIGDTSTIWSDNVNKDILLTFRDLNGNVESRELDCSYFLPTSKLTSGKFISLRDFQEWNTGEKTDSQKRRKLRDKLIYLDGQKEGGGRRIRYWACFVPNRKSWDIISVSSKLIPDEILKLNPASRIEKYGDAEYLFSGGMYTSTRGMPTGIRSEMKAKGSVGYLPNFFIVLDDPQLSFDIGRKSIPGRQLGMLREIGSDVFRVFINNIRKYIGGEPDADNIDRWDRTSVFNEIRSMPDLSSGKTSFQKRPAAQEATIAAIFFEMLGSGQLEGFKPYVSGYKNKYDLYSIYENSDVVLEFKYALASLFRDFDDENKLFDEIDIVVVWEVTEDDHEVVASRGLDLEETEDGLTGGSDKLFHYSLSLGPVKPIRVVCLKNLLSAV